MHKRYSRQILFPPIGRAGQRKIRDSRVSLIGCGALGTVNAEMLVRAGVGRLSLIDRDFVEESNLQRQSLFTEEDARRAYPKAIALQRALQAVNSEVDVRAQVEDLNCDNIERCCAESDLLVDGTDNFETRFLLNDFAFQRRLPWIYGAVVGSYGIGFAFQPGSTPCLQCLIEHPPEPGTMDTCDTAGILASVVHVMAGFQVTQALKLLVGEDPGSDLLQVDVWKGSWRTVRVRGASRAGCDCCVRRDFRYLKGDEKSRLTRLCGRNAVQIVPPHPTRVDFQQISKRLGRLADMDCNDYLMRIRVNGYEIALFADGRSIVRGTEDLKEARAVYSRYLGS